MLKNLHTKDNAMGGTPVDKMAGRKRFQSGSVVIEPHASASLWLGAYDAAEPTPAFELSFDPDVGSPIVATLDRLNIPGTTRHMLLYQFQNRGDTQCRATVRLSTDKNTQQGKESAPHSTLVKGGYERAAH